MFFEKTPRGARAAFLTILFLIAVAVPAVIAQGEMPLTANKEAKALFIQARDKAEISEDTGTMFDQVIQKDPNFAFGYLFAGQTNLEFRKNRAIAVSLADKASAGEREWIYAVRDAANADRAGQFAHLQELMKLHPRDKRVHMQMVNYYRGTGDDAAALRYLESAVKIDNKYAPAYNLIGYTNIVLGNNVAAEKAFQHQIKLIPNNPNPYDSYAEFLMNTGKFDASIVQYRMAISKDPTFLVSYQGLGNNYEFKGDFAKARETYQSLYDKALNDFNRDGALSSTMNSWIAEGNIARAIEINQQRIAKAEKDGDVQAVMALHNLSGFILLETGDINGAAKHYDMSRALENDKSLRPELKTFRTFGSHLQQAQLASGRADFDLALTHVTALRELAATNPVFDRSYNAIAGDVELAQKHYAKANEFYAKGNQQDPHLLYKRALAYEGAGDTKSAMDFYRKVAEWNQTDTAGYALVRQRAIDKLKK